MTDLAAAEALISSAVAAGIHSRACGDLPADADPYAIHDACPTCYAADQARWADEAAGERMAEQAMWNHLETNDEHREEMEADDRRAA